MSLCGITRLRAQASTKSAVVVPATKHGLNRNRTAASCAPWSSIQNQPHSSQGACYAENNGGSKDQKYLSLRAEVENPFRTFRVVILAFFFVSASVATLIATTQLIGSLGNAPAAMPLEDTATTWGIDVASAAVIWWLWRRDVSAQEKQIARIGREESLADCRVELSNGKTLPLGRLRSFCRPVLFYGTPEQVEEARKGAEQYKRDLLERGVFIVPLPLAKAQPGEPTSTSTLASDAAATYKPPAASNGSTGDDKEADDSRWEGKAIRTNDWKNWFEEQAAAAGKSTARGLYVGLRLDGRVRASGEGMPPWSIFARQLAPMEGMWGGFMDGMDGKVGGS